jgi:hypothetical protein
MTRSRDLADLGDNTVSLERQGLTQIVPTSVTVAGAGSSGSVSSTGVVSFSTTTSVIVNGCFSSAYNNYRIMYQNDPSTGASMTARFTTGGSANSNANYDFQCTQLDIATTYTRNTGQTSLTLAVNANNSDMVGFLDVFFPFASSKTYWNGKAYRFLADILHSGEFTTTTSFDGIQFIPSTGTLDGKFYIYGWRS